MLQKPTKAVLIQRSRGYDPQRPSLTVGEIAEIISKIRSCNSEVIILVDNCYGEFVEKEEPLEAGADILAGSLIKNPGGGLAPTGGYIVGKAEYINRISNAMTAPGLGKELGAFIYNKRLFYQGLFMAPHLVGESLKGAVILAETLEKAGYEVSPGSEEKRGDIVQLIRLKEKEELQLLCRAVQESSPINAHFIPVEGETPGYRDPIFMAGGTFVQGSSSELSADAPLREPYSLYLQGGLSYQHYIIGIASILEAVSTLNRR
jgi:cystathionine beta-lyase family protein involved in aluminum resistance